MIQYEYDIKEFRPKNSRKIIIFDILILIISLSLFMYYGVINVKYTNANTVSNINNEEKNQNTQDVLNTDTQEEVNINYPLTSEQIEKINKIYNGEEGKKVAYLTFDDGPSNSVTPFILDYLKQEKIHATFFLLGNRVERYPEIVKRQLQEGHLIANHGYSHKYSSIYSSIDSVWQEYEQTEKAIQNALENPNYHTNLFRFPGGSIGGYYHDLKQQAVEMLESKGVAHINWNALTNDSVGTPTKEEMLNKLKETVNGKNTVVILMHDAGDKILTYEILPEIVQYLRENGYIFETFESILKQ